MVRACATLRFWSKPAPDVKATGGGEFTSAGVASELRAKASPRPTQLSSPVRAELSGPRQAGCSMA